MFTRQQNIQLLHMFMWTCALSTLWFDFNAGLLLTGLVLGWLLWCVGVSISLHKWYSHNCFEPKNKLIEHALLFAGTLCCLDSHISWKLAHYIHHKHSGERYDPFTGTGWNEKLRVGMYRHEPITRRRRFSHAATAKFYHRWYFSIILLTWLCMYALFPDEFGYFVAIPVCYCLLGYLWITSLAHTRAAGTQPFPLRDDSIDGLLWCVLFHGEGNHNTHHRYPGFYRNSKPDLTAELIEWLRK